MNETTFRNMTDREYIRYVLYNRPDDYHAVQLALRLEAQLDAADAEGSVESDEAIDPTEGGGYY